MKEATITKAERKAACSRLRAHWATEAADAGLRSPSFGGASGPRASYEHAITDRRHGFGHLAPSGSAAEHLLMVRVLADGLAHLASAEFAQTIAVLFAALGPSPRPWHRQVRDALLRGSSKVHGLSEDEIGAALLCERVQQGLRDGEHIALVDDRRTKKKQSALEAQFRKNSGVRVWLPPSGQAGVIELVIEQTRELLQSAVDDLVYAIRKHDPGWREAIRAKGKPKAYVSHIPERLL